MKCQPFSLVYIFATTGLCTMFLWYGAPITGTAEPGFETARIESITGLKGARSEREDTFKISKPRNDIPISGPLETVTGLQGVAESIDPPNNNAYERTQKWTSIDQAVAALLPFVDKTAAASAGFDTNLVFEFHPFTPAPSPNPLGEFIGFQG
jgi:hypothetical protein